MSIRIPSLVSATLLAAALSAPTLAQTPAAAPAAAPAAPAAASNDPIVQGRALKREANKVFANALLKAHSERSAKVNAAIETAIKEANEKGKDPLVAKRDAEAKANKATQAEWDAAVKKALAERKAAVAEADKKF
jgi:hypothetical protein